MKDEENGERNMGFDSYERIFQLMLEQWEVLKKDLKSGSTEGLTIEEMTIEYDFLERFNQIIEATQNFFALPINNLGPLYRGAGVNEEIRLDYYERMIPTPEHVKNHNRMNPPGEAFIYLGVIPSKKGRSFEVEKNFILKTLTAELRAKKGDFYTVCRFESNNDNTIFDMTGDSSMPTGGVDFYNYLKKIIDISGPSKQEKHLAVSYISAQFFFNIFNSEMIFKPIHSEDSEVRANEYEPFQLWAKYIKNKGYAGIKYRSTVHEGGTNLVLFDVEDVVLIKKSMEQVRL